MRIKTKVTLKAGSVIYPVGTYPRKPGESIPKDLLIELDLNRGTIEVLADEKPQTQDEIRDAIADLTSQLGVTMTNSKDEIMLYAAGLDIELDETQTKAEMLEIIEAASDG